MKIVHYASEILRQVFFSCHGINRPWIFWGSFHLSSQGNIQKELFYHLRKRHDFKRTLWQGVFPGQIAGHIKRIHKSKKEYHVKYFADGSIMCEKETSRFNLGHFSDDSICAQGWLKNLVLESNLDPETKQEILRLIKPKLEAQGKSRKNAKLVAWLLQGKYRFLASWGSSTLLLKSIGNSFQRSVFFTSVCLGILALLGIPNKRK